MVPYRLQHFLEVVDVLRLGLKCVCFGATGAKLCFNTVDGRIYFGIWLYLSANGALIIQCTIGNIAI